MSTPRTHKVVSRRKALDWICHEWPNCACGRASQYTARPLHKYTTGARDGFEIADSFVTLNCVADHVPDAGVRTAALGQLLHPQYDDIRRPEENLSWLFARLREGAQPP